MWFSSIPIYRPTKAIAQVNAFLATPAVKRVYEVPEAYVPATLPMKYTTAEPQSTPVPSAAKRGPRYEEKWQPRNTNFPHPGNPALQRFMCCEEIVPVPRTRDEKDTEGKRLLFGFFDEFSEGFPTQWINVRSPEDWLIYDDLYLGIREHTMEGEFKPGLTRIFAVVDFTWGNMSEYFHTPPLPEIRGVLNMKNTSRARFHRTCGGVGFTCAVHEKYYSTYWLRYHAEGQEFLNDEGFVED